MAPEEISAAFRFVGNSWKRTALRSRDESRPLHGKFGQGRLRAFALGTKVTWDTVGDSTDGKRLRSVVTARSGDRNHVEVSDAVETDADTGTKFAAEGKEAIDPLDKDAAAERLGTTLAPYLIAHDSVEVVYDGQRILPAENIARDTELPLEWEHGGTVRHAKLRVIEWKKPAGREIHLCDASSVVVDTLDSAPGPDFSYSAYLLWDEMPEHQGQWPLAKMESTPTVLGTTLAELDHGHLPDPAHARDRGSADVLVVTLVGYGIPHVRVTFARVSPIAAHTGRRDARRRAASPRGRVPADPSARTGSGDPAATHRRRLRQGIPA
mgnify:CR=1 FL=1